jgi:hypothetical protein
MAARVIPRFISPALKQTAGLVQCMLRAWMNMPEDLASFVLAAVMESRYSRAQQLKQHLAIIQTVKVDLDHFFERVMSPEFTVKLLEDLHTEGLLTRAQVSQAELYALAVVDKDGQWKQEGAS